MYEFFLRNIFQIKFIICLLFSILIYLSFRIDLVYEFNTKVLVSFIAIQFIIWGIVFFSKKKTISIIFYNLFFIVVLNLLFTPIFHLFTFDVPSRQPNYKAMINYKSEFFEGIFSGKHYISADKKGFRTNKLINYKNKNKNTVRIFTIGASTTEQPDTDDNKTWSNLLGKKLEEQIEKKIEVINSGVAGLRAEHHYITFKKIKKYKPDLVIFLTGINDWNYHIINSDKVYLISSYEIKYHFKKSILFKTFSNINKQINKKIGIKKNLKSIDPSTDPEAYLLPQIDSVNKRTSIKNFKPSNVSQDYQYWMNLIIQECKKEDPTCIFLDQPTAYKKNISDRLIKRLWMTPPNKDYTLNFGNLIHISSLYNNWLKENITKNELNFCLLSDQIEANTTHLSDDCHFSENGSKKVADVLSSYINLSLKSILN